MYLWIKALHVIFMVTWFAGLFYLPRLYVYHAMNEDEQTSSTFKVMERKLFIIMTIGAVLTALFGLWILFMNWSAYMETGWIHAKLLLVAGLIAYHIWCWKIMHTFRQDANQRSHAWYRWFNEAPTIGLIIIILLAVLKPF